MAQTELEEYQSYIQSRLKKISPVFASAAIGDFSGEVEIPEKEDEFTEFFVGVQIILEAIREKVAELEATVSDLRAANDIIANEKARVEAILNSLGDAIITTDRMYHVTYVNQQAAEVLGASVHTLGQNGISVLSLENGARIPITPGDHPLARAINSGKQIRVSLTQGEEYFLVRKDKTKRRIGFTVTPIRPTSGTTGAVMVFRDITAESNMDRAKSEIISIASHQLRTPLTTIKWYIDELLHPPVAMTPEKELKYLKQIQDSNEHMIELVDHLLNVSRIDLGTLALRPEPVEVLPLLEQVLKDLGPQVSTKKLKIVKTIDEKLRPALIDPNSMHIMLQNLLSNAVKYSPEETQITIGMKQEKDHLEVKVQDHGCGIPANQQSQIFTKLFRADNAQEFSSDGSGLGLYITKAMIEQSGGKIWFTSVENKGTTFYAIIPSKIN